MEVLQIMLYIRGIEGYYEIIRSFLINFSGQTQIRITAGTMLQMYAVSNIPKFESFGLFQVLKSFKKFKIWVNQTKWFDAHAYFHK